MMSKYGFDDDDVPALTLPKLKPKEARPQPELVAEAVKAGQGLGFVAREPAASARPKPDRSEPEPAAPSAQRPRRGGRRQTEPQDKLLVAGPERVITAFRRYCDANNMSYWMAIELFIEQNKKFP